MTRLDRLRRQIDGCRACELYQDATQAVSSTGHSRARLMLVGEQPGDQEDREGVPFVGPAGRLLDTALAAAALTPGDIYVTNAVKHFRFERRGKRRIHEKPAARHIEACHPWLAQELTIVRPDVVVAMGATAGRAVLGRPVRVGRERGVVLSGVLPTGPADTRVVITAHPSSILRQRDPDDGTEAMDRLVADLRLAAAGAGAG